MRHGQADALRASADQHVLAGDPDVHAAKLPVIRGADVDNLLWRSRRLTGIRARTRPSPLSDTTPFCDATCPDAGDPAGPVHFRPSTIDTANALPAKSALNAGVKWSVLTAVPPVPQSGVSLLGGAPPNDLCANAATGALDLGVPVTRARNSTGATDDGGLGIPQVWEAFTSSECLDVTVDLCGTAPSFLNTFLQLYIDCPWTNVIDAASFNVSTCGDGNYTIVFPQLPAGTYYPGHQRVRLFRALHDRVLG